MTREVAVAALVGLATSIALFGWALLAPHEVRHSAPFGFSLTLDAKRAIAVRGGLVTANYPDFNRLDLDLRAYDLDADYDLTVHLRPDVPGASDVRTIPLALPAARIRHDKAPLADPFLTVRFPPIADSTGRRYYVWVEPGPRNRDDVVALWSVKSYSQVAGWKVLAAFLTDAPGDRASGLVRAALSALLVGLMIAFGWLMAAVTLVALRTARAVGDGRAITADRPGSARCGAQPHPDVVASNVQPRSW